MTTISEYYSEDNKERILDIGYDYKDEEGRARNLSTVAKAATSRER
jgi:hypothetical protein